MYQLEPTIASYCAFKLCFVTVDILCHCFHFLVSPAGTLSAVDNKTLFSSSVTPLSFVADNDVTVQQFINWNRNVGSTSNKKGCKAPIKSKKTNCSG